MTAVWRRWARGCVSALLVCAVAPLVGPSSAPTTPAALGLSPADDAPVLDRVLDDPLEAHLRSVAVSEDRTARARALRDAAEGAVSPKGRLWSVSELTDHGLPVAAQRAYRRAAEVMARTDPGCGLPWTLLAGIGRVESDHGRYGGARLGADGVSRPRIIGLRLDGRGPVAAIRDTDDGRLDGDRVWDRAVGPMQFIPSTWATAARDGDGDGRTSPHDLDDAAAAAAAYLCSGAGSLRDPATQAAALYRYNQDDYYVALVQAFEVGYRTGSFVMPPPPPAEEELAERRRARRAARLAALRVERRDERRAELRDGRRKERDRRTAAGRAGGPEASPSPTPSAKPSTKPKPNPKPSSSATPTQPPAAPAAPTPAEPEPPKPYGKTGAVTECDGGYCLAGTPLDLGALAGGEAKAHDDYDLDGLVETNGEEVAGLLGSAKVTMTVVELGDGRLGIYAINGKSVS